MNKDTSIAYAFVKFDLPPENKKLVQGYSTI